jgi:UDP-xylose:glucoside alpha-1,3-xylosyltransferase
MLMNLTRMRAFSWTNYVVPIYKEYKLKITWGDQDIINIIFHFHPGNCVPY